jgi:hypothetical protein
MPRIGNFEPNNAFAPFVQNSPGPVSAPNLPDTGTNIAEGVVRSAGQLANDVAESRNVVTGGILDLAGVAVNKATKYFQQQQAIKKTAEIKLKNEQDMTAVNNAGSDWKIWVNGKKNKIEQDPSSTATWDQQLQNEMNNGKDDFIKSRNFTKDQLGLFQEKMNDFGTPYVTAIQNKAEETGLAYSKNSVVSTQAGQAAAGNTVTDMDGIHNQIVTNEQYRPTVYAHFGDASRSMVDKTNELFLKNVIGANYKNTSFVDSVLNNPEYKKMIPGEEWKKLSEDNQLQIQKNFEQADLVKTADQYKVQRQIKDLIDQGNDNIQDPNIVGSVLKQLRTFDGNTVVKNTGALRDLIANGRKSMTVDAQKIIQDNRQNAYFSAFLQGQARIATTFAQGQERFATWAKDQAQLERMSSPQATKVNDEWANSVAQLETAQQAKDVKTGFAAAESARSALTDAAAHRYITPKTRHDVLQKINLETDKLNTLVDQKQPQKTGWFGAESNEDKLLNHKLAKPPESLFTKLGYKSSDTAKRQRATVIYRELNSTKIDSFAAYKDAKGVTHAVPTDDDFNEIGRWVGDYMNVNRDYYGLSK